MNGSPQWVAVGIFLSMRRKVKRVLIDVFQFLQNGGYDFLRSALRFVLVQPYLNIPKIEFKLTGYAIRLRGHFFTNDGFLFSSPAKKSSFDKVFDSMDWFNRQARYAGETGNPSDARLIRWKLPSISKTDASLAMAFISTWVSKNFRNACSLAALARVTVYELIADN